MIALVGFVMVIGAVLGGYLIEGGQIGVLMQPAELLIIGGAALGALLIGTPVSTLKLLASQLKGMTSGGPTKQDYMDLLVMLYRLLNVIRKDGLLGIEAHCGNPNESSIISAYPHFLHNKSAVAFLTDTLRLLISGADVSPHDLESLLDLDIETHREEETKPSTVLNSVGDALPGLGIVAAVLGIVITMGSIDGPPEVIGEKVGAALVGTFLGVLLSYGFMGPLARNLAERVEAHDRYLMAIKEVVLAFQKGCAPVIAVEFARRSLFAELRPEFAQLEESCRAAKSAA